MPTQAACAGVAMGLIKEGDRVAILTDILGLEDALGDMDFKIAGTRKGVTAIQMDIKIQGLTHEILKEALERANKGRMHILDIMDQTLDKPMDDLSEHAPRIVSIQINPEKIGDIIGPKGKTIRAIQEESGATIDIDDSGLVKIAAVSGEAGTRAREMIEAIVQEPEVGRIYEGPVKNTTTFGAFIEIMPGTEGLCHISELQDGRTEKTEDVLKKGDITRVKLLAIDERGRLKLSRKAALAEEAGEAPREAPAGDVRALTRVISLTGEMSETTLANGVQVLTERIPGVRSAAVGVWVRQGSAHEAARAHGGQPPSGTPGLQGHPKSGRLREIALALESLGGSLDAYTSREHTSFQARVLDEHLPLALDVLADLVLDPLLRDEDLELEREVVLEEIATVEDTPDDLVFDLHGSRLWGGHPYGNTILGTRETVAGMPGQALRDLHRRQLYRAEPGGGGGRAGQPRRGRRPGGGPLREASGRAPGSRPSATLAVRRLGTSGWNGLPPRPISSSAEAFRATPIPTRFPLALLSSALGGGMSSRLFQRVRESWPWPIRSSPSSPSIPGPGSPESTWAPGPQRPNRRWKLSGRSWTSWPRTGCPKTNWSRSSSR